VASDWTPVMQTSIGAAAAIVGGLLTAWYQAHVQERAERIRRRERAAEVIMAAHQLYLDAEPVAMADLGQHSGAAGRNRGTTRPKRPGADAAANPGRVVPLQKSA
jgi:hypothetical protein